MLLNNRMILIAYITCYAARVVRETLALEIQSGAVLVIASKKAATVKQPELLFRKVTVVDIGTVYLPGI